MLISKKLVEFSKIETAFAHCDVPCGIYDPHLAQVAALTTMRMIQLIEAAEVPKH